MIDHYHEGSGEFYDTKDQAADSNDQPDEAGYPEAERSLFKLSFDASVWEKQCFLKRLFS